MVQSHDIGNTKFQNIGYTFDRKIRQDMRREVLVLGMLLGTMSSCSLLREGEVKEGDRLKDIQYAELYLNAYSPRVRAHYALRGERMTKLREGLEEIYRSGESSPYGVQPFEGPTISFYIRKGERVVDYDFNVEEKVLIVSKFEPGKGIEGLGESRRVPLNSPAVQRVRKMRLPGLDFQEDGGKVDLDAVIGES